MIKRFLISNFALLSLVAFASGQHSDIRMSYEADIIVMRDGVVGQIDGFQIFEGTFPDGGFSDRFTEDPGFLSEMANGDQLLPGDLIELELLQSPTFGGYLNYFDPDTGMMSPTDATLTIEDNGGTGTADLEIENLEFTGDNPLVIQVANSSGEIHAHIDFELSAEAEFGGYGILYRMRSDNPVVADSQPVWLVFNYGMLACRFEELVIPAFSGFGSILGDINDDGQVNLLDVAPFVDLLANGEFLPAADINGDCVVNLLDVGPFVDLLSGG